MFNAEFGKKISKLGFIAYFAFNLLYFLCLRWRGASIVFFVLATLCMFAVAGGFGLIWMSEHSMMDFLTAGAIGVSALLNLLWELNALHVYGGFWAFVLRVIIYAFYIVLAARIFQKNRIVALLLGCAFAYGIFAIPFVNLLYRLIHSYGFMRFVVFVRSLGFVVLPGIGCLERMTEE